MSPMLTGKDEADDAPQLGVRDFEGDLVQDAKEEIGRFGVERGCRRGRSLLRRLSTDKGGEIGEEGLPGRRVSVEEETEDGTGDLVLCVCVLIGIYMAEQERIENAQALFCSASPVTYSLRA